MPTLTFSAALDINTPIVEEFPDGLKATAYFEDYLFNLFRDIDAINAAGLAYGVINGDAGTATAVVASDTISLLGGTGISTVAADGSPDSVIITNDDPFPEAPIDGDIYGRRNAAWTNIDTFGLDHGNLVGLGDDDHLQYLLLLGRAGGQSAIGGLNAGDDLDLTGNSSGGDTGIVRVNSPITSTYDTISNTTPAEAFAFRWNPTFNTGAGAYIGGFLTVAPFVTIATGTFIPATFSDTAIMATAAVPGFSAFTFINELAVIRNLGNFNLMSGLVMNIGLTHERNTAGTSTTVGTTGISFAAQTRSTISGGVMTKTGMTAVALRPTFSTVAGATVNLGNIRGLDCFNPAVALFQPGAGVETMASYIGVDVRAIPFGGNVLKVALRSALTAATFTRFIQNLSTAASEFGSGIVHINDNTPLQFGGVLNAADVSLFWNSAGFLEMFFFSTFDFLQYSSPSADRFLFDSNGGNAVSEFNFNCHRFSLGAQTGAVGNQIGVFAAPADTVPVAGGYAQFLLTQAGGLTIGAFVMSDVSAWVLNSISFAGVNTGSIAELATLKIGGMTTSNPGITVTERAALWSTGRFLQRGSVQYVPISPAVLASGNNNDWAGLLTGSASNSTRYWARITSNADGTSIITGIDATAVQDGDSFEITNVGAFNASFGDQDVASVAANRIITPTGVTYIIGPDESVVARYDSTTARWRLLQGTGA